MTIALSTSPPLINPCSNKGLISWKKQKVRQAEISFSKSLIEFKKAC